MVERGQLRRWTRDVSGYTQALEPFIVLNVGAAQHPSVRVWMILEMGTIKQRYEDTITNNSEVIDGQGPDNTLINDLVHDAFLLADV